jgi:4-phytase / acid phosphatase
MLRLQTARPLILLVCCVAQASGSVRAQAAPPPTKQDRQLRFVVYLSRHGVRSPTATPSTYNIYSTAPWPGWNVPPGYLTAHGYDLMKKFGAYDRLEFASQGLLSANGCQHAGAVTFYADSDQRTRETGKALAEGLYPGCSIPVRALPEGVQDPLFHSTAVGADASLSAVAISGRIGGDSNNLTAAYRPQLIALDQILATCGAKSSAQTSRTSLLDIPATLSANKNHLAELRGPLNTASTLSEILLLEYTQGMDAADVGWGCVDGEKLRYLMQLHVAAEDYTARTPEIAQAQGSKLLDQIRVSMQQAVTGKPVPGAISKPSDHVFFLVGHDTNLANIAGILNINWIADGRRDDTPPGAALVFELWMNRKDGTYSVRTYFTTQKLEQMRSASELTIENPPERVPVFLPGCSREDFSCAWPDFERAIHDLIDPRQVETR